MEQITTPDEIISFWRAAGPDRWFAADEGFDRTCRNRFLPSHEAAARGDLDGWQDTPEGALALVLLLDQFSRNMFRGSPRIYETDPAALAVAERAVARGFDTRVDPLFRQFFYLPFMHSEDLSHQVRSISLYEALADPDSLQWARHHHGIVARFGRFPHRNVLLGRRTTPEEEAFLAESPFRG
ncbi:MAG: DUF924 family protein [Microvirga sp.]